jgi:iron(III) transport system permease protein
VINTPIDWLGSGGVFGIVALQTIHLVPVMYLTVSASLRNSHKTLEEAAIMSGASYLRTVMRIVVPLSTPGIFAGAVLVFIGSFTDLGTPLVFEYRSVISVQIYDMLSDLHENRVGYSFVVFACFLCTVLFLLAKGSLASGHYAGSGRISERGADRSLRSPVVVTLSLFISGYAALTLLPQCAVLLLALSDDWFMSVLPSRVSLTNMVHVLEHPLTVHSLLRSLGLSIVAALLTLGLGFLMAIRIARGGAREQIFFEGISLVPLAVPGIVFAFGFISAFSHTILDNRVNPFPLLIAAYAVRRLPSMVRSASAGFQEATRSLEEAALMVGASPFRVAREVVFPLMRRHLVAATMLTFAYSMVEVSDGILLALEERFYPVSKAMYVLMSRPDGLELASALGVIVMAIMAAVFFTAEALVQPRGRDKKRKVKLGTVTALALFMASTLLVSSPRTAAAEGDEVVIVSSHWEGIKKELGDGFKRQWRADTGRDITLRWLDIGGTSDIIKYIRGQFKQTQGAGIGIDIVFGGGVDSFLELQKSKVLAPAPVAADILSAIPPSLSGAPLRDLHNEWFAAALSTFGIVYNKVAAKKFSIEVPTRWSDLAEPRYFGLLGAADPRKSGSMHAMYEVILQGYGWEAGWKLLRRIGANVRVFSGSAMQVAKDLSTAEILCAISIDTHAGDAIRKMGAERIGFVVPSDLRVVNGDAIALLKGAPNYDPAVRFIEFVLSPAGQRIWYGKRGVPGGPVQFELGKLAVRPDIYGTIEAATITEGSPFSWPSVVSYDPSAAARRWNLVNDLFGAFVIDVHDRLRSRVARGLSIEGIPVTDEAHVALVGSGSWGESAVVRSEYLNRWAGEAHGEFREDRTVLARLKTLPAITFLVALLIIPVRRVYRGLKRAQLSVNRSE